MDRLSGTELIANVFSLLASFSTSLFSESIDGTGVEDSKESSVFIGVIPNTRIGFK